MLLAAGEVAGAAGHVRHHDHSAAATETVADAAAVARCHSVAPPTAVPRACPARARRRLTTRRWRRCWWTTPGCSQRRTARRRSRPCRPPPCVVRRRHGRQNEDHRTRPTRSSRYCLGSWVRSRPAWHHRGTRDLDCNRRRRHRCRNRRTPHRTAAAAAAGRRTGCAAATRHLGRRTTAHNRHVPSRRCTGRRRSSWSWTVAAAGTAHGPAVSGCAAP